MLNITTQNGPVFIQVREYRSLEAFYVQTDVEQGLMILSLVLYVWCLVDIIYKVNIKQK